MAALTFGFLPLFDFGSSAPLRHVGFHSCAIKQCQRPSHRFRTGNALRRSIHQRHVLRRHSTIHQLQTLTEVDLMPAMRKESRDIIKDVEIFGVDPLSALESAAKKNPLDIFKDFLSGYASTVIIGGDIGHFLERKAEDIFKARATRVKAAAERLGMLLETFIIVMVMMSLCFYILFAVNNIQTRCQHQRKLGSISLLRHSHVHLHIYAYAVSDVHLFGAQHATENAHT